MSELYSREKHSPEIERLIDKRKAELKKDIDAFELLLVKPKATDRKMLGIGQYYTIGKEG